MKLTHHHIALLRAVRNANDHHEGFRSYTISGGGTKGSNFHRINEEKRADKLVEGGFLVRGTWGLEITEIGRAYLSEHDEGPTHA